MHEVHHNRVDRRRVILAGTIGAGAALTGLDGMRIDAFAEDATPSTPSPSVFDHAFCYTPLGDAQTVQYDAVGEGPFNIALSNSNIGNVWRTQMIQMVQAFVQIDEIASMISDFQVNSSGTDDTAQIAAIEDMFCRGAQAIVVKANTPGGQETLFGPIILFMLFIYYGRAAKVRE
jgi:ABC-type sugar transport system substrate-binding protein